MIQKWLMRTWKTASGQGADYTPECILDYPYLKEYYKILPVALH